MRVRMLVLVCVFVSICAATGHTQTPSSDPVRARPLRILATGRLLGYLRQPDRQDDSFDRCSPIDKASNTDPAKFVKQIESLRDTPADKAPDIRVAVGDNFAPDFLARVLDTRNNANGVGGSPYVTKDRYAWEWNAPANPAAAPRAGTWVRHDAKAARYPAYISNALSQGTGFIPADNVACFFLGAGFDVLVPGHHDFYFGPERLRMLARLMASPALAYDTTAEAAPAHPAQMLATNLVIRTSFIKDRIPSRESSDDLGFEISRRQIKATLVTDGDVVLPYTRKFGFSYDPHDVPIARVYLRAADPANPHHLSADERGLGDLVQEPDAPQAPGAPPRTEPRERKWVLPAGVELEALKSYGVCVEQQKISGAATRPPLCVRFSVDAPFFQYPNPHPWTKAAGQIPYNDPDPFFVKRDDHNNVIAVVFGAVHPKLREHVGQLNFVWRNADDDYKTEITVVDPARALSQLLDYFDYWYKKDRCGALEAPALAKCVTASTESFQGHRILVAQMPPPEARELGARIQGFSPQQGLSVVISEAEAARATPNQVVRYDRPADVSPPPMFLLVPRPGYDVDDGIGIDVRSLTLAVTEAGKDRPRKPEYTLAGDRQPLAAKRASFCDQPSFQQTVGTAVHAIDGQAPAITSDAACKKALYDLALYAMRRRLKSDVAILQTRDLFFDGMPADGGMPPLGEIMKRIVWKGDFLTERMVPGSTLKAILKQGQTFDQDDAASLSLAVEKGRGIVTLGITPDKERKEFLVNGTPLDDKRLYTVATSDYAAQGDTGFPELMSTAVRPTVKARDFRDLYPIDEIVTANLAQNMAAPNSAVPSIYAPEYLDELKREPADPTEGASLLERLGQWFKLARNRRVFGEMPVLERTVQERPEWFVSLQKFGGSWAELQNNLSEKQRKDTFSGTATPELKATSNRALTIGNQTRIGVSGHLFEVYTADDLAFSTTATEQEQADFPRLTTYSDNKANMEVGIFGRLLGKALPHVGPHVSYRMETRLRPPVRTFTLKEGEAPISRPFDRPFSHFVRLGGRFEGRQSSFSLGYQAVLAQQDVRYEFHIDGREVVSCGIPGHTGKPLPGELLVDDCVKQRAAELLIDTTSSARLLRTRHTRHGAYAEGKFVFPLAKQVAFTSEHNVDWFPLHEGDGNSLIRFRYTTVNALDLKIIGNLSVQPSVTRFVYRGQGQGDLARTFTQWKASIGLNYAFDWFGGNGPGVLSRAK